MNSDKVLKMRGYQNALLMIVLDYNSAVIRYASVLVSVGELKPSAYKKSIEDFNSIHKQYIKNYEKILKDMSGEFPDGR